MSSIAKGPWLAIYLVAGFAVITGLFVLLGFPSGRRFSGRPLSCALLFSSGSI